jgi:hypothetical protein
MTPLQAAKEHCANYQPNGSCLGIYYSNDLSVDQSRYRPCTKCLLAEGQRCPYFEEIVVPMKMSHETAESPANKFSFSKGRVAPGQSSTVANPAWSGLHRTRRRLKHAPAETT